MSDENGCGYFESDAGRGPQLFFGSTKTGGLGGVDLYSSDVQADGPWGPSTPIPELDSTANDNRPNIRHDGLEIFFYSNRAGGTGANEVWVRFSGRRGRERVPGGR